MNRHHLHTRFFFLLAILSLFPLFFVLKISDKDRKEYEDLMEEDRKVHSKSAIEEIPINSVRQNVHKKLWIYRDFNPKAQEMEMTGQKSHLSLVQKKGKIEVVEWADEVIAKENEKDTNYRLEANTYYLDANSYSLEGNLQFFFTIDDQPSIALCDTAFFDPEKKKVILESLPEKKVLFSQEGKEISAKRIEISDQVEAIGNVHLFFNEEEKERIRCLFSK